MERLQPRLDGPYGPERLPQPDYPASASKDRRTVAKTAPTPKDTGADKTCRKPAQVNTSLPALRAIHDNVFAKLSLFFWYDEPVVTDDATLTDDCRRPGNATGSAADTRLLCGLLADLVERKGYTIVRLVAELAQFARDKPRDFAQCRQFVRALFSTIAADHRKSVSSADVRTLLALVARFDGSFSDLFNDAFIGDGSAAKRAMSSLEFALSHAANLKVSQETGNGENSSEISFVDAPMTCGESALLLAARRRRPKLVELLLRHGADPRRRWLGFRGAVELLLFAPYAVHVTDDDRARIESCMRHLARAVTSIDVTRLAAKEKDGYVALHPAWRELVPRDRFRDTCSLRHLSRCAVRASLLDSGALPAGISRLPIPQMLKDYTDLRWD
ncbi:hypothetical protein NP493_131g05006 [Ridgeia piscesae]|uniref:Ankyrin repeat and SOCS box protein 17 n=1 Tax=Ridgeia piscesae TaxID=27915 RepID=A0AAD9P5S1_RIDPI|nr:hypothetical protein NP493_131g05006 [Ridgeia piscesae]